ncbi:MAG: MFS transporter [Rothia sp. (in: high G+C Gram-positive bacteria)]|nr:MFS transporter [Rothia sp. (in: high G+C Gram-positive bacteria)]
MAKLFMDTAPLRVSPEFRRIWLGNMFSAVGFQVTAVAIALEIYALTQSPAAVGLTGLVALPSMIVGGLYGGVIADHYDRRKVALTASMGMWILAMLVAAQAWTNLGQVWVLYALIAIESLLQPVNQSARGAIIPRLVKRRQLPAANTLMMSVGTLGMSLGPLLGGLLVAQVGYKWTYLVNVFAFMVGLWALYKLPAMLPDNTGEKKTRGFTSVVQGLAFVKGNKVVGMSFVVDLLGMLFAQARPLIPALAALTFGGGEAGAGFLLAAAPLGALAGLFFSGFLSGIVRQGRFLTLSYAGWGGGFLAFGLVVLAFDGRAVSASVGENLGVLLLAAAPLAFMGWADALGGVYRSTIIQTAAPDSMRGRLQGLFIITVAGGPNLGFALVGASAEAVGSGYTALAGGAAVVVLIALATLLQPALWRYTPEPVEDTVQIPTV